MTQPCWHVVSQALRAEVGWLARLAGMHVSLDLSRACLYSVGVTCVLWW